MKNLVRAFVAALVVTGAVASAHTATASTQAHLTPRASFMPIPACPPDGSTSCGLQ